MTLNPAVCRVMLVPFLLAVAVAGCDIFGKPADYFPTGTGSVWEYQGYVVQSSPTVSYDSAPFGLRTEAAFRTRLTNDVDVTAFVQSMTMELHIPYETTMTVYDTAYYRELNEAVLLYATLGDTIGDTVLALPLTVGKCWGDSASMRYTCVGQEDLTVAAGTYRKAWKIALEPVQGDYHQWYANRIGLAQVRGEGQFPPGYRTVYHYELVSATVK